METEYLKSYPRLKRNPNGDCVVRKLFERAQANNKMGHPFLDSRTHVKNLGSGASLTMQAYWRALPEAKKIQLRKILPDSDRDGVPDKFDCQPLNPKKQGWLENIESERQKTPSNILHTKPGANMFGDYDNYTTESTRPRRRSYLSIAAQRW